jgi:O-antigen ligase
VVTTESLRATDRQTLVRVCNGIAVACLTIVLLEVAVSFLPDDVFLRYFTVRRLLLGLGLIAAGLVLVLRPEERRPIPRQALVLAAPAALLLLSYIASAVVHRSPLAFPSVRLLVEELLVFVLVLFIARDRRSAQIVLLIMLLVVAAVSFEAIRQFTSHANTHFFMVDRGGWTTIEVLAAPADGFVRVVGYFNNPNLLGAFLVLVLPFAWAFAATSRLPRWVTGVVIAAGAVALVLTFSRAPLLSIVLALVLIAALRRPLVALLLLPVAAAVIFNPFSLGRLTTGLSRIDSLKLGLEGVVQQPLVGVGPGAFRDFAEREGAEFWNAHNSFLNVAAEVGVVGGLSLVALVVLALLWTFRLRRERPRDPLVAAFIAVFVSFTLVSLLDAPYNTVAGSYMLWVALGLLVATCGFSRPVGGPAPAHDAEKRPVSARVQSETAESRAVVPAGGSLPAGPVPPAAGSPSTGPVAGPPVDTSGPLV